MTESARRDFIKMALAGALAAVGGVFGGAAQAEALGPPIPFDPTKPLSLAKELARSPFKPPPTSLPEPFGALNYDQYSGIRRAVGSAIWGDGRTGFSLEPLHRGFLFTTPIDLYLVENGVAQRIVYDRSAFEFGKLDLPAEVPDIGFSGVRVLRSGGSEGSRDAVMFQGATFYRSLAKGQAYGVTARGLSIRTGDPQGEEFPLFRAIWIEKPTQAADTLVIHALLDSASLTGAYRFTLRAGDATIIDTELTLVARTAIDHIGFGSMAGAYLFGGLDHRRSDDARLNVYDVTGLQIYTGAGEWIWRPVANRATLQASAFSDRNPKGFGLLQRTRNFDSFGDDEAHWELRPSLWIEPIGDWGDGEVLLLEIPSDSETNDNIIAQWRPKGGLAEGATISLAYRQFWCWTPPTHPPAAIAMSSRIGRTGKRRRFVVEFVSDAFADPQKASEVTAAVEANPGQIPYLRLFAYKERRSIRVVFDLDPGSESYAELRLVLKAAAQPVSETWLYRWTA